MAGSSLSAIDTKTLTYTIDPGNKKEQFTRWSVEVDVSMVRPQDRSTGWRVHEIRVIQRDPDGTHVHVDKAPPITLWWIDHVDPDKPELSEFRSTPRWCGHADPVVPDGRALQYCMQSSSCDKSASPRRIVVALEIIDTRTSEPLTGGDDLPGDIDDGEDPPGDSRSRESSPVSLESSPGRR